MELDPLTFRRHCVLPVVPVVHLDVLSAIMQELSSDLDHPEFFRHCVLLCRHHGFVPLWLCVLHRTTGCPQIVAPLSGGLFLGGSLLHGQGPPVVSDEKLSGWVSKPTDMRYASHGVLTCSPLYWVSSKPPTWSVRTDQQ